MKGPLKVTGLINAGLAPMEGITPSLISAAPATVIPNAGVEFMVAIDQLDDSPFQAKIRRVLDQFRLKKLSRSLQAAGQSTPIEVRKKPDGRYEIIKGHYRKHAAKAIGWQQLRALLVQSDDRQARRDLMLDNEGTKPTEYSYGHMCQSLLDDGECSVQADVAAYFGRSQAWVSSCLAMLKLPPEVLTLLDVNPGLLGATAAKQVREMWKQYPKHRDLILQAIKDLDHTAADTDKLVDGDLDEIDKAQQAKQGKLRQVIESNIAAYQRAADKAAGLQNPKKQAAKREDIKGYSGQVCYTTVLKDTGMTVEFKDPTIDRAKVQAAINKALEDLIAESLPSAENGNV